jgi:hypothetical protein
MSDTNTPMFEDTESTENDLDLEVEDDANLDVDVPADDEVETVTADAEKPATASKSTTPRTKAPEGYVKPVEFAKILSEHLNKPVAPQVVYSYIKNNAGESAKNPFPTHTGSDGYEWYIKPDEGLAWWDNKNTRVTASKEARAVKAAKKAEKPEVVEAEATTIVEAE